MYKIEQLNSFKKQLKLAKKRGLKMALLDEVVTLLATNGKLPAKYKTHVLIGNTKGF